MQDFPELLEEKRSLIDRRVDEILSSGFEHDKANELVKYTFRTGGKRLRPTLLILSCEAINRSYQRALDAAVGVEFIHAASLIFDDLIDKDRLRRNFPTTHAAFNDDRAISSGLFLASKGVQILSDYKDSKIMEMIGWALVELSKGEILDVTVDFAIDTDHYLTIADLKTGSLFSAAAGIGGIIGGGTKTEINALYNYGRSVGVAFQIRDDILDLTGGKSNAKSERANIVLAHYLETSRRERIGQILDKATATSGYSIEDLKQKAIKFAEETSMAHIDKAKAQLQNLREPENTKVLESLAEYALSREH